MEYILRRYLIFLPDPCKETTMRATLFVFVTVISAFGATGISSSTDSIRLHNSIAGQPSDSFTLTNNTGGAVSLDSAIVIIREFDSSGIWAGGMQLCWGENGSTRQFLWNMEKNGSIYKLKKNYVYPSTAVPLVMGPGEKCSVGRFEIGMYLASSHYPIYPAYFSGILRLYFNSGTIVEIVVQTDDLRNRGYNSRFAGLWLIDQPTHGGYEATLYRFSPDGTMEILKKLPAGYETGTICRNGGKPTCSFGTRWHSHGADTLVISCKCSDSITREATMVFPDSTKTNCQNPFIWCGVPLSVSVEKDTVWNHCGFSWRWTRCVSNESYCYGSFSTAVAPQAPLAVAEKPITKVTSFTLDGRKINLTRGIPRNRVVIRKIEYRGGGQEIRPEFFCPK
jgi:hypothetical protein